MGEQYRLGIMGGEGPPLRHNCFDPDLQDSHLVANLLCSTKKCMYDMHTRIAQHLARTGGSAQGALALRT